MVGNIATMERYNIGYAAHITLLLLYITFASLDFVCAYACMFLMMCAQTFAAIVKRNKNARLKYFIMPLFTPHYRDLCCQDYICFAQTLSFLACEFVAMWRPGQKFGHI